MSLNVSVNVSYVTRMDALLLLLPAAVVPPASDAPLSDCPLGSRDISSSLAAASGSPMPRSLGLSDVSPCSIRSVAGPEKLMSSSCGRQDGRRTGRQAGRRVCVCVACGVWRDGTQANTAAATVYWWRMPGWPLRRAVLAYISNVDPAQDVAGLVSRQPAAVCCTVQPGNIDHLQVRAIQGQHALLAAREHLGGPEFRLSREQGLGCRAKNCPPSFALDCAALITQPPAHTSNVTGCIGRCALCCHAAGAVARFDVLPASPPLLLSQAAIETMASRIAHFIGRNNASRMFFLMMMI